MKNSILFCCLMALLIFSSCKKDADLEQEMQKQQNEVSLDLRRSCGMQEHHSKMMTDENYRKNFERKVSKVESMASERSALCDTPTILPVAVHFQGISSPDPACLRLLAKNQIDILNADYTSTNDDISNWTNNASSSFPNVTNGETCVKFCLATKSHPNGYNLSDGDLAVTINQTTGDQVNAWAGYVNIFVRPNLGFLGYSPLGGEGNGDGVVVDASAFGSGSGCGSVSPNGPYDLGRTLTHELGHYLLLDHIWGGNGGCNDDDGVADTPVSTDSYYGCPNIGVSTCNSTDLHMNYMDYTDDACMYMFTAGQSTRMENYFNANLQNVINNAANVCEDATDPTPPTCSDGIQNGQETGVDCGGPDCTPCAVTPTCNDGIQNGQETGVDCGGPDCTPCNTNPSDCDGTTVLFDLILDDYGSETSWFLADDYGNELLSGGPFEDGTNGQAIQEDFCLEDGCYYIAVLDEYGDGICCYYGEGSFSISDENGGTIASSNGEFGYWDYLDFCVRNGEVDTWGFRTDPRSSARSNSNKRK